MGKKKEGRGIGRKTEVGYIGRRKWDTQEDGSGIRSKKEVG